MSPRTSNGDLNDAMDELLNLEEKFYKEGYEEGLAVKAKDNFKQGKQYGLQVGLQRFLLLGEIEGYIDVIAAQNIDNTSLSKNIEIVRSLLRGLRFDNSDETVADFDSRVLKIKNKFRTILLVLNRKQNYGFKDSIIFDMLDKTSSSLGGTLKAYVEDGVGTDDVSFNGKQQDW